MQNKNPFTHRMPSTNSISAKSHLLILGVKYQITSMIILKIDKICRSVLWAYYDRGSKEKSFVTWKLICQPKRFGGLGITNLTMANQCLLLRRWFKFYNKIGHGNNSYRRYITLENYRLKLHYIPQKELHQCRGA